MHVTYCIIGAGPTGLGAAHRLRELGEENFLVLERNGHVGGLSASFKDSAGFTWDLGGHVVFSHYEYYDKLLDSLLGDEYLEHQRVARVRMAETWVPYPFQNNIRHLPPELQWECVQGLLPGRRKTETPNNFGEWIDSIFGPGIARLFMRPYNYKVWATPPENMAFRWIGERVSVVDLEMVLKNILLQLDDVSWGPNHTFKFPLHGGTGEIYTRMAEPLMDHIRLSQDVASIDPSARTLRTTDGLEVTYEHLLNTGPLDRLVLDAINTPATELREAAGSLVHNSVYVAGVGVDGMREDDTCWMYFPEENCPYYRLTNFHNYSPNNSARPGKARALMAETSFSRDKPENLDSLMDATINGLANTAMINEDERGRVLSRWETTLDYGYPVPGLGRDKALTALLPWLEGHNIYSRGRFGTWLYEVANMDHSVMQGVEWADRMLRDKPETTFSLPTA